MAYLLLIIGFIILIKGADFFVDGASNLAKHLKWPSFIIGLTIVAFGTSAPEAAVSFAAAIHGETGITLGNIVGSNLINASLIIGSAVLILPMSVHSTTIKRELPFALLGSMMLIGLIFLDRNQRYAVSRFDGLILFLLFVGFFTFIFWSAKKSKVNNEIYETPKTSLKKSIVMSIIGLIAIIFGGEVVSTNAANIATSLGMSETLVGLTIVAIGTSLPELATAITAALKKETNLALGNIVGSNIFNIFFILGISAMITPIAVSQTIFIDMIFLVFISIILLIFSFTDRLKLTRFEGYILLSSYVLYIAYLIFI